MPEEQPRSRAARAAAERALVRVVHHYGSTPEFVLIGGLVPELLCSGSAFEHSGTTDVDVQVNLEIAAGAVNAANLERALRNAEFEPDEERVWRWKSTEDRATATVKFELLADLETERSGSTIEFVGCEALGAANLRGTGYAVRDRQLHTLTTRWKGEQRSADLYVTGLAGFLMAKSAAARSRRKNKDWYDIAYVLVHNDLGGPQPAARRVLDFFAGELVGASTALDDLRDNFADVDAQGAWAYADEMKFNHGDRDLDLAELRAEAVEAVRIFHAELFRS